MAQAVLWILSRIFFKKEELRWLQDAFQIQTLHSINKLIEDNLKGQVQIAFMSLSIWNDSTYFNEITSLMYDFSCVFLYIFHLQA